MFVNLDLRNAYIWVLAASVTTPVNRRQNEFRNQITGIKRYCCDL
jgi:hypothetical protein